MTVQRLEDEMTGDELDDWMEFYQMEPFGNEERMADKRNGLLCAVSSMGGDVSPSNFEMYQDHKPKEEEPELSGWEAKLLKAMTTI